MQGVSSRKFVCLLVFLLAVLFPAFAQAQRVTDLVQGARVRVHPAGWGVTEGVLESVTADSITVVSDRGRHTFAVTESVSISRSAGRDWTRGMLRTGIVSGLTGSLIGAAIGAKSYKPCDPAGQIFDCRYIPNSRQRATVFGGVIFGVSSLVVGGLVGAVRAPENWVPVRHN